MSLTESKVVHAIEALMQGGHAHATLEAAVKDFPVELRGRVPAGLPYSAWQILEHIRIAQRDMLDFSDNAGGTYKAKAWPDDYWPKQPQPSSEAAWEESIAAIRADQEKFFELMRKAEDLSRPFAWGDGQSLLKEALQIADHNAYHVGELIVVRRLLGCWR